MWDKCEVLMLWWAWTYDKFHSFMRMKLLNHALNSTMVWLKSLSGSCVDIKSCDWISRARMHIIGLLKHFVRRCDCEWAKFKNVWTVDKVAMGSRELSRILFKTVPTDGPYCNGPRGEELAKQISFIPYLLDLSQLSKLLITYWMSRSFLPDVAAAHPWNRKVMGGKKPTDTFFKSKISLKQKLMNSFLVTITQVSSMQTFRRHPRRKTAHITQQIRLPDVNMLVHQIVALANTDATK